MMISREHKLFLKRWLRAPMHVGAVAPSSRQLGDAMARLVPKDGAGAVIELGGGTGVITASLLRSGIGADRLVVVERDGELHRHLQERFPGLRILHGDAAKLGEALKPLGIHKVDAVVSGLPLLSMPKPAQDLVLEQVLSLLTPGGLMIQYTYGPMSPVDRRRFKLKGAVAKRVAANLPPASVWVYRRESD
jgi:phosphatidylethanolamine/phosphatidyl-N-methylethanolamine N-methyltransferase